MSRATISCAGQPALPYSAQDSNSRANGWVPGKASSPDPFNPGTPGWAQSDGAGAR